MSRFVETLLYRVRSLTHTVRSRDVLNRIVILAVSVTCLVFGAVALRAHPPSDAPKTETVIHDPSSAPSDDGLAFPEVIASIGKGFPRTFLLFSDSAQSRDSADDGPSFEVTYYDGTTLVATEEVRARTMLRAGPQKPDRFFEGWYSAPTGGMRMTHAMRDLTLYARYTDTVLMDVPMIPQLPELPTGCEIVSVAQMLSYAGVRVDKTLLAQQMPRDVWDPALGFIGDPFSWGGWTIYPPALTDLVAAYVGSARDLTGSSIDEIRAHLSSGRPVVVWVGGIDGFDLHAVVLTGFTDEEFFYNDCWSAEKNAAMPTAAFIYCWSLTGNHALSY
jgi:uncharacterized protein YvpB